MADSESWKELNRAVLDKSLYTADLRTLRRYHRAILAQPGPHSALQETVERLMSLRTSEVQLAWVIAAAAGAIIGAIASILAIIMIWS